MKKLARTLALVLVLVLLTGCTVPDNVQSIIDTVIQYAVQDSMVKFSEMEYIRPDMDAIRADFEAFEELAASGASAKELENALDVCYVDYYTYDTMYTLADIHSCIDITDEYYAGEFAYCSENYAVLNQLVDDMYYAAAAADCAETLEDEYFWEGFCEDYSDSDASYYNDETVALMQRESNLISRYRSLCASPVIEVDGREVDYYDHVAQIYDKDSYIEALRLYYEKYNAVLGELFIELIQTRNELAYTLGFDSYEELAYVFYQERDYTPAQADEYLLDIKEQLIPLYRQIMSSDPYSRVDYGYMSERKLKSTLGEVTEQFGGKIKGAYDFMVTYELCDLSVSTKKAAMSFQTYIEDYNAPFLFLDAYGDIEDILSFSHEFGHYTDAYMNYNAYETVDVSECFSQAMEFLVLANLDGILSDDQLEQLRLVKMLDVLDLYAQQGAYAEFEHEAYLMTDPTVEKLNELSLRLTREYGFDNEDMPDIDAMGWTDITHFFEAPFYVITYPIANDFAMQIYELELAQPGTGVDKYIDTLTNRSDMFMDTLQAGGMENPFADGRMERIADIIRDYFKV